LISTPTNATKLKLQQMTRFNKPIVLALMQAMLPRAPACYFTKEDVDMLAAATGLTRVQIEQWEQNFRSRVPEELRQARIATPEKDDEKVKPSEYLYIYRIFLQGIMVPHA
jgi:hypothetical protein